MDWAGKAVGHEMMLNFDEAGPLFLETWVLSVPAALPSFPTTC